MKRLFDILFSFIGIFALFPLFVLIILVICIIDGKPAFFVQKRIGRFGVPFRLYKFRSMSVALNISSTFEPGYQTRVTKIGKFFRKTKLDELPQLFNVFIGNMSFVGPRPEVDKWVKVYPERWKKVLTVKPGITDNASLLFRNEENILATSENPESVYLNEILPRKLDLYEEYIDNMSFKNDLIIIFKTMRRIIL